MRNQENNISRLFEGPSYLGRIWIFRIQLYRADFNSIKPFVAIITSIFIFCSYGISESRETYTNSLGMKFVLIESGIFMMGSLPNEFGRSSGEHPQHQVKITKPFFIQTTEVTQAQWKAVMGTEPWKNRRNIKTNCENCPVVYISWNTVTKFIKRLNEKEKVNKYRLPTEAEWEYSCRAGTKTAYYFGDDISKLGKYAWSAENTYSKKNEYAHPVALKKTNKWGLFDMHGNVWEMCSDWFGENYYHASPKVDPTGPPSGNGRVMRGGSYEFNGPALRCARRMITWPSNRLLSDAGFRLVMEK